MKIGMMGMGKLGLPVALATASRSHQTMGFDISPLPEYYLNKQELPYQEIGAEELLADKYVGMARSPIDLIRWSDIIFVAVQTPHEPQYEGATPLPESRADFDYSYLKNAIRDLCESAALVQKQTTVVVISTCLPGTYDREIAPLLNGWIDYVYNPFFIAMGTVIPDFLNPEFILMGFDEDTYGAAKVREFYQAIHFEPKVFETDIITAEGIKVFYNTFITAKTVLGNIYGEMAFKLGMQVDHIHQALSMATDRIISPKYLEAGMGDGGGCHPRDNIALAHLAAQVDLSHNIFEDLMQARQDHAFWLAEMMWDWSLGAKLPMIILGRSFKPETNIETGSASMLVSSFLKQRGIVHKHVEDLRWEDTVMAVYLIGTKHERYKDIEFPKGSVVIDPFRYIPEQPGVKVIRIGGDVSS